MKKFVSLAAGFALAGTLLLNGAVLAADSDKQKAEIAKVRAELSKMIPPAETAEIIATDAKGVYRLAVQGSFAYAHVSGDYVLIGDLYNTDTKENLGEIAQAKFIDGYKDKMIVFGPKDADRHITVFTDIDCGYCRKLHQEVPELNKAGVQVRYLAFPRAGVGSESYNKYVSVWCSDDPQKALTDAKSGQTVASATCENPISETYSLGRQFGVNGTPTIIIDDGTRAPGYVPSAQLLQRMGVSVDAAGAE